MKNNKQDFIFIFILREYSLRGTGQLQPHPPPFFFLKIVEIFYTIRSVYLCSDCMRNLTCNFNLISKICEFFLQRPFLKVYF